jgi:twitching motility protein PilT
MKPIEELLKNLGRPEVLEFGLVTNRLPSVNIGGKFEPVDDEAPTTDILLQMLVTMGGSRYVEQLSERPVQWTTRLDGVGVIAVAAIMRKDVVQARFTVARRDAAGAAPAARPATAAGPPPGPLAQTQVSPQDKAPSGVSPVAAQQSRPAVAEFRRTQQGPGGPQPPSQGAQVAQAQAQTQAHSSKPAVAVASASPSAGAIPVALSGAAAGAAAAQAGVAQKAAAPGSGPKVVSIAPGANPLAGAVPPPDEWDDDDEPTVQTLSPPVAPQLATQQLTPQQIPGQEPKAKPARKPGEVASVPPAAGVGVMSQAEARALEDRRLAEERAAAEANVKRVAEERAAAADTAKRAAEERASHERKIIEERAAAERKAAEDRKLAEARRLAEEQRNAVERKAQEQALADRAAAEKRAAVERAAAERNAAAERAAAERKAAERAKVERRISTPTSVDAVDVEITTSDSGTRPVAGEAAEDNTVELATPGILAQATRPHTAAMLSQAVASAVPSTTPSAAVPEKDRPRADGALESFLAMAAVARASDIHVVAGRPVLLRVATDLLPRTQPILAEHVERIAREIVPARLREGLDADGSCDFTIDHPLHGRFRVNVSRQRTGYKLSMRVVPREIPTLASLALPEALGAAAKYSRGLVLVTGPAGQGKTSTLAAIVDILNRDTGHHVISVEDPVEFVHPRKRALVSQREIGSSARSTAVAIAAAEREDPNVIVIGELRDADAVRAALTASENGHLVLATMSTATAAKTIDRLIEMFPLAEQAHARASIAGSLRLIIGQRLVPSADRTRLHAAVELLPSSIALYTLIRDSRTFQIPSLQQRGRAQGVVRLDESLADLVRTQKVTLEVAKQFAESPQELEAYATRSAPAAAARKG